MEKIYNELLQKNLPEIPLEIREELMFSDITQLYFEDKNILLSDDSIQREVGYTHMPDGNWLVAMICPMPGINAEMLRWWFWWHPQESVRYQVWYPNAHKDISFRKKDRTYFEERQMPPFKDNIQYPKETIGNITMPLSIAFTSPEEFGFSKEIMESNNIPIIICGHVGVAKGMIMHTEMAHIFKKTDEGGILISRFWIGNLYKTKIFKNKIFNENMAIGMAEHCCVEYRNLAEILPILYDKYGRT